MYCPKCHKAMDPELPKCMYCGYLNKEYDYGKDRTVAVDYKSTPLNIVSFFIPFVGLAVFFIDKDNKPKKSKSALYYAVVGFIIYVLGIVLFSAFSK